MSDEVIFHCETCNSSDWMDIDQIQEHLKSVHNQLTFSGTRQMITHMDGGSWYGGTDRLTIGEVTLTSYYRYERDANDPMKVD